MQGVYHDEKWHDNGGDNGTKTYAPNEFIFLTWHAHTYAS